MSKHLASDIPICVFEQQNWRKQRTFLKIYGDQWSVYSFFLWRFLLVSAVHFQAPSFLGEKTPRRLEVALPRGNDLCQLTSEGWCCHGRQAAKLLNSSLQVSELELSSLAFLDHPILIKNMVTAPRGWPAVITVWKQGSNVKATCF